MSKFMEEEEGKELCVHRCGCFFYPRKLEHINIYGCKVNDPGQGRKRRLKPYDTRWNKIEELFTKQMQYQVGLGFDAEERFRKWSNVLLDSGKLPNVSSIRKASRIQDRRFQTDFFMRLKIDGTDGIEHQIVRIQVKLSKHGAEVFRREHPNTMDIHIIIMNRAMNIGRLEKRLDGIAKFETEKREAEKKKGEVSLVSND